MTVCSGLFYFVNKEEPMANKLQFVSELADHTAQAVTRDAREWKRYLAVASRLYKYPFDDQILIYAQRPSATACASMELWNETMRRWVKPGSKGIALIHKRGGVGPRLEYVFDVEDTRPVKGAKTPYLWELREDHHAAVVEALEQRYGPTEDGDIGEQLMELARRAVDSSYDGYLNDLAYDARNNLMGTDGLNLEVRFRDVLTASVQYAVLIRCGLKPDEYIEDDELAGITGFITPAVLHHLGNAVSGVSKVLLNEIGRAVKSYDLQRQEELENISEKPLANEPEMRYTDAREEFNDVKHESKERSDENERTDLHEGGRLPGARPGNGRTGGSGGVPAGQVRDAAGELSDGKPRRNVHVDAADRAVGTPSEGDRPSGAGAGGQDGGRPDETQRRERGIEGQGPDGVGAGGEQLHPSGRGAGAGGDRLQVNRETAEAAGGQPAASLSPEQPAPTEPAAEEPPIAEGPSRFQFNLFPTVEEQVEAIAQAQAEEKKQVEIAPSFVKRVSDTVIGRALTSGSNEEHSIERIVAFFQKNPRNEDAATFLEKEYGVGGKGVTIAGIKYAIWFDKAGIRICPGNNTHNLIGIDLPWPAVAVHISRLLQDGTFATQEKIDAAPDNEYRELAVKLWQLRQDLSDNAREQNLLPTVSNHFLGKGFPEATKELAGLLHDPASRQQIVWEMAEFAGLYENDSTLLRFKRIHDPQQLLASIVNLFTPSKQFKVVDGFAPARATLITEDEIDQLLKRGSGVSEGKIRIYAYFMQGHDAKECAAFLKHEYGEGGQCYGGYNENHSSKGIKFTRSPKAWVRVAPPRKMVPLTEEQKQQRREQLARARNGHF